MVPQTTTPPQKSTKGTESLTNFFAPHRRSLDHCSKAIPEEPTFHLFPKLLPPIRRKIWLLAHQNSSRIIEVTTYPGTYGLGIFDPDSPYHSHMGNVPQHLPHSSQYGRWDGWEARANQEPVLLHVSSEARKVLQPLYATPFNREHVRGSATKTTETKNLLFCWEKDTLLINLRVFRHRGNSLKRIFCQLFGTAYRDDNSPNSIKKKLRHLAGNHEFWMSLFRHPAILPEFTTFFEEFTNLEIKYVPLYLQKRSGTKLLGFEEDFLVKGRWGTQFRGDFFKMPLNWYTKGRKTLDKLCKQNAGGSKYIKSRKRLQFYTVYAPQILRWKALWRRIQLLEPPPKRDKHPKNDSGPVFTLFPNLPLELRRTIWDFALPDRRFVTISVPPLWNDFAENDRWVHPTDITYFHPVAIDRVPAQFFACQEARELVNKRYIPLNGNDGFGTVFFDPEIDVICFDTKPGLKNPTHILNRAFLKAVPEEILNRITSIHICLFHEDSRLIYPSAYLWELMDRLPNLQEVFSKTNYWDYSSGHPMIGWRENKNTKWLTQEVKAYLQTLEMNIPQLAKLVRHGKPKYDYSFDIYLDHR